MIQCGVVPSHHVSEFWGAVEPLLAPAVEASAEKFGMVDVLDGVLQGKTTLWIVNEGEDILAAGTTYVVEYPRRKSLALEWLGGVPGRMKDWQPVAMDTIEKFAKTAGCSHLEGYGRDAWGRNLTKFGWNKDYTAYCKELSDG